MQISKFPSNKFLNFQIPKSLNFYILQVQVWIPNFQTCKFLSSQIPKSLNFYISQVFQFQIYELVNLKERKIMKILQTRCVLQKKI